MNDELSNDIKKKLMLPLTIELQDYKEKVSHSYPVFPTFLLTEVQNCLQRF